MGSSGRRWRFTAGLGGHDLSDSRAKPEASRSRSLTLPGSSPQIPAAPRWRETRSHRSPQRLEHEIVQSARPCRSASAETGLRGEQLVAHRAQAALGLKAPERGEPEGLVSVDDEQPSGVSRPRASAVVANREAPSLHTRPFRKRRYGDARVRPPHQTLMNMRPRQTSCGSGPQSRKRSKQK